MHKTLWKDTAAMQLTTVKTYAQAKAVATGIYHK